MNRMALLPCRLDQCHTMQRWGLVLYIGRTMSTVKKLQPCGELRQITEAQLRNIRIRRLYVGSK
jgi:hypothetical protein